MAYFGACPRCNNQLHTGIISGNIKAGGLAVCSGCGWYESHSQAKARIKTENQAIGLMAAVTVTILALSAHMLTWGTHSMTVPFLKVGQWTGMLSTQGYHQLASICTDLGKLPCATGAYIENFRKNGDNESLQKLARLQLRAQDTQGAMTTFSAYFKNVDTLRASRPGVIANGDAALLYGQLLEQNGQDSEAMRMFELSIAARSESLPIAATGAIVRIMMKQGRYEEARERLVQFHESAGNAKGYLNTELSQIEQAIKLYKDQSKSKRG
ncbi:MAG: hypothetical protein RBT63_03790 [Bdellovibrionales bacterium]|jgi:hypothetical protein|nr:hypothetical protein [Bdellovibrionales bacterium]